MNDHKHIFFPKHIIKNGTMGVRGLARFLAEEGWYLPDSSSCCSTSLWRDPQSLQNHHFAANVRVIPPRSTLLVDGHGLVFYLTAIAYARHVKKVVGSCKCKRPSPQQIHELLWMPLEPTLTEVVHEWVRELIFRDHLLQIYWDSASRMKNKTLQQRSQHFGTEWNQLEQYILHGILPSNTKLCQWHQAFPKSRLLQTQIQHILRQLKIDMYNCEEDEADVVMARWATGRAHAFIIAQDTDFCFFPNIQYIPIDTIEASSNQMSASVITRQELAEAFHVDEDLMINWAILLGNDFHRTSHKLKPREVLDRGLLEKVPDTPETRFSRAFYELKDLSEWKTDPTLTIGEDDTRLRLAENLSLELARIQPQDESIMDAVTRCLQDYLSNVNEDETMIQWEHLHALEKMNATTTHGLSDRPRWEDVKAVYVVEKVVAAVYELSTSIMTRVQSPAQVFDPIRFYSSLLQASSGTEDQEQAAPTIAAAPESPPLERIVLPVDEHQDEILDTIRFNRVTIIQGGTGCGKSTRIPVMMLQSLAECTQIFMSQPRRIAAKALVERIRTVEPSLRDKIALRMGHGVKEYECPNTRAWFVTTGYLVRLLANNPDRFEQVSHIIIDEVHERSVDTDILCLLCRRLLNRNRNIKLVLMSATMAAELYQKYFNVEEPPIVVGARRFPVEEVYLDNLTNKLAISTADAKVISGMIAECNKLKARNPPPLSYMEKLYNLVSKVALIVGNPGTSVLIFVPGMNEIIAISELIEKSYVSGVNFTCFPIHSDIPFEDQMNVFEKPQANEVKIIIATNAAESSVTLPDVDNVICLGLCKQIVYNESSHRQMLVSTWISKASATQRAGRTGRLRPGTVFRMYTKETYDANMPTFEPGEIVRTPLDSVILMLKEMLTDEKVTSVLMECLEPPNISTIGRSFESLHKAQFITQPDDDCDITTLGTFVLALGIDLSLGNLVGLGIQNGVAAEAIEMAAILSFPQTPWIISNPLVRSTADFNEMSAKTYVSRCHFDAMLFSEPLATMNMLWEFERVSNKQAWCWKNGIAFARVRRLASTCQNLRTRVADHSRIPQEKLRMLQPPTFMPHAKLTVLRIIQVWVFHETLIECHPKKFSKGIDGKNFTLELRRQSGQIKEFHLNQVLTPERHTYRLHSNAEIHQNGHFTPVDDLALENRSFFSAFEDRIFSFGVEKEFNLIWFMDENNLTVFVDETVVSRDDFKTILEKLEDRLDSTYVEPVGNDGIRRGRKERPCGLWKKKSAENFHAGSKGFRLFAYIAKLPSKNKTKSLNFQLDDYLRCSSSLKGLSCEFLAKPLKKPERPFKLVCRGNVEVVKEQDLKDLFATPYVVSISKAKNDKQTVVFSDVHAKTLAIEQSSLEGPSSWNRPLLHCIPEGIRLLSVLASSRRREHIVRFDSLPENEEKKSQDEEDAIDIYPEPSQTKISGRWTRFNSGTPVYVAENSVPATALPFNGCSILYAVCANTLEVRGGGLKAEGLTLLPPGRLFLLLCRLSFGLFQTDSAEDNFVEKCLGWVLSDLEENDKASSPRDRERLLLDWTERVEKALHYNKIAASIGEALCCLPENVRLLLAIFEGVDGYSEHFSWTDLDENPYVPAEKMKLQANIEVSKVKKSFASPSASREKQGIVATHNHRADESVTDTSINANEPKSSKINRKKEIRTKVDTNIVHSAIELVTYPPFFDALWKRMFLVTVDETEMIDEDDFPSTNIMALIIKHLFDHFAWDATGENSPFSLSQWSLREIHVAGKIYYQARFLSRGIPYLRKTSSNKKKKLPAWIRECPVKVRPETVGDALDCIPRGIDSGEILSVVIDEEPAIIFSRLDTALRMEAAFWLERQFRTIKFHWYQQDLQQMANRLVNEQTFIERKRAGNDATQNKST